MSSSTFSLFTLGELRLVGPSGGMLAGRRKELVLLTFVARRAPKAVSRDELAALLWGERDEEKARQSLRHAIHQLRRALEGALEVTNDTVRVVEGMLDVDACLLERDIAEGRLADAVTRWKGELLRGAEDAGGDTYRSWLEREREALRRTITSAFSRLVDQARAEPSLDQELHWARRWTDAFPNDEAAHLRLADVLQRRGEIDQARAIHAAFLKRLRDELELAPSIDFIRLGEHLDRASTPARERRRGVGAIVTPDLVGRGAAVGAALLESWLRVRADGSGAIIEGEEGTGKTRLCAELVRRARGAGQPALVLETRASADDASTPWSALRRLTSAFVSGSAVEDAPAKALAELSGVLPALRSRFPQLAEASGQPDRAEAALRDVLRVVASNRPVLIVVDDLGRADADSRRILRALMAAVPRGVMIVVTLRSDDASDAAQATDLGEMPGVRRYKLAPLQAGEVAAMVESMLEMPAADRQVLARRLFDESAGIPSHVTSLVPALADIGALTLDERGVWRVSPDFASRALPVAIGARGAATRRPPVVGSADGQASDSPTETTARTTPISARRLPTTRKARLAGAAVAALLLVAASVAVLRGVGPTAEGKPTSDPSPRVAVLDLDLVSRDTADAYLASGLAEEINSSLSRFDDLRIKSRGAVRTVRKSGLIDPVELGRALRVDYLVEGSVRHVDQRFKVAIRLTQTSDGFQVWGEDFDATATGLPALHERIAREIASRVGSRLTSRGLARTRRMPTSDPQAYEHYLRGNYYLARRTPPMVEQAITQYRRAVARDPSFAAAHARIAYSYAVLLDWGWAHGGTSNDQLLSDGLRLVREALELDSASADAWMARAYLLESADPVRMHGAAEAFERAIALDPRNVEAVHQYAQVHEALGNWDAAMAAFRRTLLLEPDRSLPYVAMASIEWKRGHPERARQLYDTALVLDPGASYVLSARSLLRMFGEHDVNGALEDAETAVRVEDGYSIPPHSVLAIALAKSGSRTRAELEVERALSEIPDPSAPSPTDARFIASALLAVGRRDDALSVLERARPRGAWMWFYTLAPDFDAVKNDPRFVAIVRDAHPMTHP